MSFLTNDSLVNNLFYLLIIGVFLLSLFYLQKNKFQSFVQSAPTILSTLGILGTFVGIFKGLLHFNVQDIDGSIPTLLAGLKLAFSTSILGMSTSLLMKCFQCWKANKSQTQEGVTAEDIYSVIDRLREASVESLTDLRQSTKESIGLLTDATKESIKAEQELLNNIRSAISGDNDSSLVTQIQKLRTSFIDEFADLRKDFNAYAEKMAENNSKALIQALEEVLRDFNAKINEQFGENFKHLNEAVGAMLEWQKEYKQQVEILIGVFKETASGIEAIRSNLNDITTDLESVPNTMEQLRDLMVVFNTEIEELDAHLKAFKELKESAVQAFPIIKENMEELTSSLSTEIKNNINQVTTTMNDFSEKMTSNYIDNSANLSKTLMDFSSKISLITEQNTNLIDASFVDMSSKTSEITKENIENISRSLEQFTTELTNSTQHNIKEITEGINAFTSQLVSSAQQQDADIRNSMEAVRQGLEQAVANINEVLRESFGKFDTEMQREIERTISTMGTALSSLSNKFVQDYNPLTDKLRDLVELASTERV